MINNLIALECAISAYHVHAEAAETSEVSQTRMLAAQKAEAAQRDIEMHRMVIVAEITELRRAAQAVLDGANRPGARRGLNMGEQGEDIWIGHHEVEDRLLDGLRAALPPEIVQ